MLIEFDTGKREATLQERGLDMAQVEAVFNDVHLTRPDNRRDYGEARNITIGYLNGRMVVVVWTERGAATRIIILRKANEREQAVCSPRFGR